MIIVQAKKNNGSSFQFTTENVALNNPLVLVFGNRYMLEDTNLYTEVKEMFPNGNIVFGSTSGEILGDSVTNNSIVLTAIEFKKSSYIVKSKNVKDFNNNEEDLGSQLIAEFPKEDLRHIYVVSEGSTVNGSALIAGIEKEKDISIGLSGGLCGDDDRFERTLTSYNENPKEGEIVAIGFYGTSLEITSANYGGWTGFGPERIITKSKGNILYELDGKPALDLYKKYLGEKANELPKSALLYPLSVKTDEGAEPIVRTILNIDEDKNTMILAGDVPEGSIVQLMMSTVDDIAEGANKAAVYASRNRKTNPELALLVSCIGRKLVMDQRTEEEVEEVLDVIGNQSKIMGYYSYGEMAPFEGNNACKLHNQTMTLTLISE
ncbi:FIST C-terminal domain-containing protein [Cellulophaga sp. 20_2_10]|uniref:FIST signal transduction protein n=1 Tax=Cellulophaga sp. 20_2_10 TaxID=2942476 RepID=UPI00201AF977|nr:FIST N-terminal domain-containing protein [Cellulophaga sp. 20_2_10]MCL5246452.1 FIST C-terminal domain-containing protein [Cellulophaga sp. 20_2_10]